VGVTVERDAASADVEGIGVAVSGRSVGKGVIGSVAVGCGVGVGANIVGVVGFSAHPARKITNKINITTLDKFNLIKGPFVTRQIIFLMLELPPEDYS
jgi:hypothetical protein